MDDEEFVKVSSRRHRKCRAVAANRAAEMPERREGDEMDGKLFSKTIQRVDEAM